MAKKAAVAAVVTGGTRFCFLSDRLGDGSGMFFDLDEQVPAVPPVSQVVGNSGLRGQVLIYDPKKKALIEQWEQAERTPTLVKAMIKHHQNHNSWVYDWPHLRTEQAAGWNRDATREKLEGMLRQELPYEVKVVGLDRRYLWYFSDGSYKTQFRFQRLENAPDNAYPFTERGAIKVGFSKGPSLARVRHYQGEPSPYKGPKLKGIPNMRPLLYAGPALVVRVELDGQTPLMGGCRMFLTDDLQFICSDWCQRDASRERNVYEVKGEGIDLVNGASYTASSWLQMAAVPRATNERKFTPKSTTTRIVKLAKVAKGKTIVVPSLEEALSKHLGAISVLFDSGITIEEALDKLRERLKGAQAKLLHKVPVYLNPEGTFKEATRARYLACEIDGHQDVKIVDKNKYLTLIGYTETPGTATVQPQFLAIDEVRVRAQWPKAAVAVAKEGAEPAEPAPLGFDVIQEAERLFEQRLLTGRPEPKWVPEKGLTTSQAAAASAPTVYGTDEQGTNDPKAAGMADGTCKSCHCSVEDGVPGQGQHCYAKSPCIFVAAGQPVPLKAQLPDSSIYTKKGIPIEGEVKKVKKVTGKAKVLDLKDLTTKEDY